MRDYNEEIRRLTVTFTQTKEEDSQVEGERRQIINRARYLSKMIIEVEERLETVKGHQKDNTSYENNERISR